MGNKLRTKEKVADFTFGGGGDRYTPISCK